MTSKLTNRRIPCKIIGRIWRATKSNVAAHANPNNAERVTIVNEQRDLVLQDPTEDPVHDLRVALRRLEQIFDLFDIEPLGFDTDLAQTLMKDWMRAAGAVRDCDVIMPLLTPPWTDAIAEERQARAQELVAILNSSPPMPAPPARKGKPVTPEVAQFASIVLPREAKAYFQAGRRAARKYHSLGRLHEFRLHGKSLRYSVELFDSLYGPRILKLQKMLKRTQQLLGEMADARAGLKMLKKMDAPDAVLEPMKQLANEKRDAFAVRWFEEVPDERAAAQWVEYLRRYAKAR